MADVNQPFILKFNGTGAPTMTTSEDAEVTPEDNVVEAIITTSQDGPPVPIAPDGAPLDLTVAVQNPYSLTMPPGVIRVG